MGLIVALLGDKVQDKLPTALGLLKVPIPRSCR